MSHASSSNHSVGGGVKGNHARYVSLRWIVIPLLLLVPLSTRGSDRFEFSGYFKNFSVVYDMPNASVFGFGDTSFTLGSSSNRLRLNAVYHFDDRLTFEGAYNFVPRIQDHRLFLEDPFAFGINPRGYRFDDLDRLLYPDDISSVSSFGIYQNLDRAFFTFSAPRFDLYVGRQAIAWGTARVVNPTDVLAPYAFTELDSEYRVGIDAVRLRWPIGFMGEFDVGYVAGRDFAFTNSAVFGRGRFYAYQTNFSVTALIFRENLLIGFDMARSIGGAGFWFEAAEVIVGAIDDSGKNGNDYLRFSTGADYSFTSELYGFVEYHFNQAGSTEPADYFSLLRTTAYQEGSVYLLGEHYLIPGVSYQITPLITATGDALINLADPSVSLTPYVEYNISENIYVALGAYIGIGKGPTLSSAPVPHLQFGSEFGAYPNLYYSSFKIYF